MFIIEEWIRIEYYSAIERRKSCQLQQHRWTWGQYPKWNRQRHYYMISLIVKEKVLMTQSCMILCDPMDCILPGSSVHGILQTRILEWVPIPFSGGSSRSRDWTWVSCITGRFFTIWATREALLFLVGFFLFFCFLFFVFFAALDLPCFVQAFSGCSEQGLLSSCSAQASHFEHHQL